MNKTEDPEDDAQPHLDVHDDDGDTFTRAPTSRMELLWDVVAFQFKLALDGFRDLILIPISLIAAVLGLIAGGDRPAQYFRRVLLFGRRTEIWINLFGHRRRSGTSDELLKPLQEKVFAEAHSNPWINKAGTSINRSLDKVGQAPASKVIQSRLDPKRPANQPTDASKNGPGAPDKVD